MPSKRTPRGRPPSPYGVPLSQSPRPKSQQRVWRSLNATGSSESSNAFAEKSREMWLKSLRQGSGRSPVKGNHNLNTSLSSTSEFLREQLSLTPNSGRKHKRSNSVELTANRPGSAQYKSPEDMYDEITSLKKTIVAQKSNFDVLKARNRRLEEENTRKEKCIQQQLDTKSGDIRRLAESGSQSGGVIAAGLQQRILKLEKQLRDKEQELAAMKSDIKMTDFAEMKTAMEIYYQEVLRLREVLATHEQNSARLTSSLRSERDAVPSKIKDLRRSVVQLTTENNQLLEDNKRLRRDLDRVLDGDDFSGDEEEEEIKYSALSQVELISLIKKNKKAQVAAVEADQAQNAQEFEKLKGIILQLKEEKNELREENEKFKGQNENLENDLDKQTDKVENLRKEIEKLKKRALDYGSQDEQQSRDVHRRDSRARRDYDSQNQRKYGSLPKQRSRSTERNNAAISIQRQWRRHKTKDNDDGIVMLQSAFRGHLSRSGDNDTRGRSFSRRSEIDREIISEDTDSDDEVVYLQSALSGHLERRGKS